MEIEMYKMNNLRLRFSIYDQDDLPVDLSNADIYFVVKTPTGKDRDVIKKETEDINIIGEDNNICEVEIMSEDTEDLTPKEYKYELLVVFADGSRYTAVVDNFILKDVIIQT